MVEYSVRRNSYWNGFTEREVTLTKGCQGVDRRAAASARGFRAGMQCLPHDIGPRDTAARCGGFDRALQQPEARRAEGLSPCDPAPGISI